MHQVFEGREWIKTGKDSIVQRFKEIRYRMKDKSKTQIWKVDYYLEGPNEAESLKIMFSGRSRWVSNRIYRATRHPFSRIPICGRYIEFWGKSIGMNRNEKGMKKVDLRV